MANEVSKYLRSGGYDWGSAAPAGPAPVAPMTPTDRPFVDRITGDYSAIAENAANRWGIDPRVGKGMMLTESSGRADAHNKGSDAVGLFQMTPIAVKEVNRLYGTNYSLEDRWDPEKNADMAMAYFRAQLEKAGGDTELALRYYNGGYDRSRWGEQNAAYAGKVLKNGSAAFDPDAGDQRYARDAMQNAMRYNAPEMTDFGRRMDMAMAQYDNDLTSGGSGYLQSLMGDTTGATNAYRDMMAQNQEISGLAKPQDQFSKIDWSRPSELMDYGSGLLGELTGNVAKTGGYALGGAALGGVVGALTPIPGGAAAGANIGARLGAFIPTAARYIGNNWGNSLEEDLKGIGQPTDTQVRSAIESQDALDNARIAGVGVGRAALETAGLGGMASLMGAGTAAKTLLPGSMGGKAIDVLSSGIANPLAKDAAGAALGGVEEVGDTYLEAIGAGRPVSSVSGTDALDAFMGGSGGHGMAVGGANAITNPSGTKAAVKSLLPGQIGADNRPNYSRYIANEGANAVPQAQYLKDFYGNKDLRERTRAEIDRNVANAGLNRETFLQKRAADQQAAEQAPLPSYTEIYKSLKAEHDAKLKVTEDDYQQAVNQFQQDNSDADLPPQLISLAAFKKAHKESLGKAPTMADAQAEYRRLAEERKGPPTGPWRRKGDSQLDMYGDQYGKDPSKVRTPEAEAEMPEGDRSKQMEMDLPNGYTGTRRLTRSGDIYASQTPVSPVEGADGQLDMLGTGYGVDPSKVTPVEEDVVADEPGTDPRQQSLDLPETSPELVLKNRQARRLEKARARAEEQSRKAEEAKANAKATFINETNAAIGPDENGNPQIRPDDMLGDDGMLITSKKRGPKPGRRVYRPIFQGQGADRRRVGYVLRDPSVQPTQEVSNETANAIPEEAAPEPAPQARRRRSRRVQEKSQAVDAAQGPEVGPDPDRIIAQKLAEQQQLLKEREAKPTKDEPTVDDPIAKVDEIRSRPKKTRKVSAAAEEANKATERDIDEAKQSERDYKQGKLFGVDYVQVDDISDIIGGLGNEFDYSKNESNPTQGTTADKVNQVVSDLTGKDSNWRVWVFKTVDAASAALGREIDPKAKAFVVNGRAHFITDNIAPGSELAVFLHEVGAHLGMERILTPEQRTRLTNKIKQWAESGKGVEAKAAKGALQRGGDNLNEQIAYFVEEAVKAGVNPMAMDMKSDLGRWFRQLWAAMKTALRRLGVKNLDNLSAQDVVNLAYGAARLELSGNWHGSAKNFNKFSNRHRGTGEGGLKEGSDDFKDMIAFGQYFAGKRGTAEGYRDAIAGRGDSDYVRYDTNGEEPWSLEGPNGKLVPVSGPDAKISFSAMLYWADAAGDIDAAIAYAEKVARVFEGSTSAKVPSELRALKKAGYKIKKVDPDPGVLYNVDFNIKDDEWLDWGKPMLEQSEKVRNAFDKFATEVLGRDKPNWSKSKGTGDDYYGDMSIEFGSEKKASEYLNNLGVKGVRYLDAGSRRRGEGTYNYVVFDPKNVVVGNKNSPRTESGEIQYSFKDFVNQATESELGATTWGKFKDFVNDMKTMPNTLMYLSEWLPDRKSLKALYAAEKAMQASQGKIANQVSAEVDNIRALANQDRKQLFRVMTDATLSRAHPDAAFDDKINAHLEEADRQAHAALQARYNALSPEAKKAYKATRDMFQNMTAQRIAALNKLADNMLSPEQRDAFQREIDLISRMSPGPYFPLVRFGNWIASWRSDEYVKAEKAEDNKLLQKLKADENHYRVSFEETKHQAQALSRKWEAEGGTAEYKERVNFEGGVNIGMKPLLDRMTEAVELSLGSGDATKEATDALRQTFIAALPDTSILHSALKRQNVAGVKPDQMLMAIAKHGSSQAFHLSRLEHMPTIQDGLKTLRQEDNKAVNAGDDVSIYAMVSKGLTGALTPDPTSLASTLSRLATYPLYAGRLALNPSFWLTNLMAPLVITAPYIGGRYGNTAAVAALRDAGADAIKILMPKKGQRGFKDLTRFSFLDNIDQATLPADEVTMLKKLMDEGLIDENQIRELANIADGNIGKADDIKRVIGAIPHRVEGLNRISSALAAYRLEAKRNGHEAGMAYAEEVVTKTQINYTVAGTPFILRRTGALGGPVGKLFSQFMRYQIGMGLLMAHTAREAFNPREGTPQAQIDEARRKLTGLVTAHALVTGTNGFFGASAMLAVAQWVSDAFHDDDDEPDLENELKKLTDYTFGKKGSLVLRKGLPALMGIDLSQRVGMGDLLNIRRNNPLKGDGREMRAGVVDAIPALSNTIDWIDWAKGGFDPKKMPVSLVSNIAKSADMRERGMVNTHGVTKIGPEEFTFADTISQALGFAPLKSNEAYKAQSVVRETEMAIQSRRQELMDQWNEAMSSGDADALAEARKEIVKFNERHSGKQDMVISTKTLTKSRKQRMSRQGRMTDQGVYIPKRGEWRQRLLEETQ